MKVVRGFDNELERYEFDFVRCLPSEGWAQVDTAQDASYYGNWANPIALTTLNFAEGDITVTFCENEKEFVAKMRRDAEWTEQAGYGPMLIDAGFEEEIRSRFIALGLGDLLH